MIFGSPWFWRLYISALLVAAWFMRGRELPLRARVSLGAFIVSWWAFWWCYNRTMRALR